MVCYSLAIALYTVCNNVCYRQLRSLEKNDTIGWCSVFNLPLTWHPRFAVISELLKNLNYLRTLRAKKLRNLEGELGLELEFIL